MPAVEHDAAPLVDGPQAFVEYNALSLVLSTKVCVAAIVIVSTAVLTEESVACVAARTLE